MIGSPTEPSRRSDERSWRRGHSSPCFMNDADRRRRRVQDRDPVVLDDLPPAVPGRRVGRALVEDPGRRVGQRPEDDVAVAGHPADVGGAPVDVVGLDVEDGVVGEAGAQEVARRGVHDALRLGRRPRRVEQVEHVLRRRPGPGRSGRTGGPRARATSGRGPRPCGRRRPAARRRATRAIVGVEAIASSAWCLRPTCLPRRQPPSAVISTFAPASLMRSASASAREAAEDDGERRPDPGAGEHRDRQLGDHRQVDRDPVARRDAQLAERVGGPVHAAPAGRGR